MKDEQLYSKNDRAKKVVGLRDVKGATVIINSPAEMDYRCPVCLNEPSSAKEGWIDERLEWSEYNGFLYCSVCDKDYPSALCQPDIDKAIKIYLKCVEDANERYRTINNVRDT